MQGSSARMALEKDGSKLVENSIKMILFINGKHKNLNKQLYEILDEILNLPMPSQQEFFSNN
jgi:hypothetical protein